MNLSDKRYFFIDSSDGEGLKSIVVIPFDAEAFTLQLSRILWKMIEEKETFPLKRDRFHSIEKYCRNWLDNTPKKELEDTVIRYCIDYGRRDYYEASYGLESEEMNFRLNDMILDFINNNYPTFL